MNFVPATALRQLPLGLMILTLMCGSTALAQTGGNEEKKDSTVIFTPGTEGGSGTGTGSQYIDSVFMDGKMIRLTVRISEEMRRDSVRLRAFIDSIENSTAAVIARNLAINPEEWKPTAADIARREEEIAIAQDREYIYPQDVTRAPLFNAPVGAIATSLGLKEDVTPRITYILRNTTEVTVKIYTQGALPVVTLVDDIQRPGEYVLDWDFNDANGRRVLPGSYFAEVISDSNTLLLRKRIVAP